MQALWVLAAAITTLYVILLVLAMSGLWPDWLILDPEENASA